MSVKNKSEWSDRDETMEEVLEKERKARGLGDVVELVAQPVAKAIDKIVRTNIQNCGGCKKRKEFLNKKFPLILEVKK